MFGLSEELMSEAGVHSPSLVDLFISWGNSQDVDSSTVPLDPMLEAGIHKTSPVGWSITRDNTLDVDSLTVLLAASSEKGFNKLIKSI